MQASMRPKKGRTRYVAKSNLRTNFAAGKGVISQEYFVYFKKSQRIPAVKFSQSAAGARAKSCPKSKPPIRPTRIGGYTWFCVSVNVFTSSFMVCALGNRVGVYALCGLVQQGWYFQLRVSCGFHKRG